MNTFLKEKRTNEDQGYTIPDNRRQFETWRQDPSALKAALRDANTPQEIHCLITFLTCFKVKPEVREVIRGDWISFLERALMASNRGQISLSISDYRGLSQYLMTLRTNRQSASLSIPQEETAHQVVEVMAAPVLEALAAK
ncbi:MAG: hypothetical protein WC777_00165 [Candidatus Gracilibacteria bacterium]|jgi:hypothetical protein